MNKPLKIILLAIAVLAVGGGVVLFALMGTGTKEWNSVMAEPTEVQPVNIRLMGRQFYWTIWYPGEDGVFGERNHSAIDSDNLVGLLKEDPQAWDDLVLKDEFWFPVEEEINFEIMSVDVIHAAYMPHFRMKMDAVPGMTTSYRVTAPTTTEDQRKDSAIVARYAEINKDNHSSGGQEQFNFQLACAEICGKGHFGMRADAVVSTRKEYDDWLSNRTQAAQTMNWSKENQ